MIIPVKNAIIALVAHIACLFVLMYVFDLKIYAVVISTAFFAFLMCILNGISVQRYSRYKLNMMKTFVKPGIASAVMGVIVYAIYYLGNKLIHSNALWTVICILCGMIVYGVVLLVLKDLTEEELKGFPKGTTLARLAKKFHLL